MTLSQRRERRGREKVRGKKKERQREGRDQMSTGLSKRRERRADIILIIYIIGRRVIFENKYLLTLAHLYIVINYANHLMSATLL
jgi:hypothetical protein